MFSEFLDRDFQYAFIEAIFGKSVETICHQTVDLSKRLYEEGCQEASEKVSVEKGITLAAIHSVLEPGRL
jgi:retron-type reverse transcriptase